MIPFNVEKHFIISDEVAEPHGIIFSVVWVNHCGINYSLQTSFKNLCTTCDKFLVSSYTRQLLLCWLGEQAAQHNLHKAPISKTPRGGWHTPAASHWDFLQWEQKTQIQEGFWKENSFTHSLHVASKHTDVDPKGIRTAAKWLNGKYLLPRKQPPSSTFSSELGSRKRERHTHKSKQCKP